VPETRLATLMLFAFNQEGFVEAAVRSALDQDYSPLQVILSDDCSSDRTFEIMDAVAGSYRGPHEIILNRNETNLGLAGHLNKLAALATGEVIVVSAGDDLSYRNRTRELVSLFERNPNLKAVLSGHEIIDRRSSAIGRVTLPTDFAAFTDLEAIARSGGWIGMGATYAYHRDCFLMPEAIPPEVLCEDRLLPFRAALLGDIGFVRRPLVQYRVHDRSATALGHFRSATYEATHQRVLLTELEWAVERELISLDEYRRARRGLLAYPKHFARERRLPRIPLVRKIYNLFYHRSTTLRRLQLRLGNAAS
jgi:cellulose synthase/poly-beta-1,6-N-acetylglucosamine synthase-like glycosyltransferase